MIIPARSHRFLLLFSLVIVLLIAGLAPVVAQGESRLEISVVDSSEFPDVRVAIIATDGESRRQPGIAGLALRENDLPVESYEVAELPVGIELTFVIDANPDIEARDEGGPTRYEKVRDSILRFAEMYMDAAQLDRVSIIVPDGQDASVLLDRAIFPNEVINEINFAEIEPVADTPVNEMLTLAIDRAAESKEEGRFQAILLYSDAGRLDSQLDYAFLSEQAQAIDAPIFVAILGARADESEIANVTALTEPTRGGWVHMPQPEETDPLFEIIDGNRPQFEVTYRSALSTSGPRQIVAEVDGAQAQSEVSLEIALPATEIVVDNSRPIRRVAPEPGAPLVEADPSSQPIVAQVSWPDGYPRSVTEAVLIVDGKPQIAEATPAVDEGGLLSLEWDISELGEGSYELMVQVVDELGLEGQSAPLPMAIVVEGLVPEELPEEIAPTAAPEGEVTTGDGLVNNLSLLTIGVAFAALFSAVIVLVVVIVLLRRRQKEPVPTVQPPTAEPSPVADHDATQVIMPAFAAQKEVAAYLEPLENAPDHQGTIPVSGESVTIGRDAKLAQIVFADKSVSRLHARFMQSGGTFRLYDEGSASGTYVNYEQVGLTPQVLSNNDDIHIGRVHLRFHIVAVEDDADSTQIMPAPQPPRASHTTDVDDGLSTQPYMPQQPGQYEPSPDTDDDEDDISTQPYMPHQPRR